MGWSASHDWTYAQVSLLWELAGSDTPILEISSRVGKSYEDVCAKAAELGIPLMDNYLRRKKSKHSTEKEA